MKQNIIDKKPFFQQDLIDNANNGYFDKSFGFVFGKCINLENVEKDLWEGPTLSYVFPTVGQQMAFSSSSESDSIAGTGVQKVHIHYLDSNYIPHVETVDLNGITPVNTVATDIFRINSMHAMQVGTGEKSVGNISLKNIGGTITYGYISAGNNTARQAIYTVPAGYNGYISHWQASSGSSGNYFTQITLKAKSHMGIQVPVFLLVDEHGTENGGVPIDFTTPIRIHEKTDVKISAIADKPNAGVIALGAVMGYFEKIDI